VSLDNDKGKNVLDEVVRKGQDKKRRKMYEKFENSKMFGQHNYHGWNRFLVNKVKFIKFVVGFVHLSMIKRKCLP
jgi:hypothetical protein